MAREYHEPKSLNEIIDQAMLKDGFDVTTGEKIGKKQKPSTSNVPSNSTTPTSTDDPSLKESVNADEPSVVPGEPIGEEPVATGEAVEGEELKLDSGTEDMPLEERTKSLMRDYTKKTTAISTRAKELEDREKKLEEATNQVQQLYDYTQSMLQRPPSAEVQPSAPKQKFSTLSAKEKAATYAQMGIQVDEFTDDNLIRTIDFFIDREIAITQQAETLVDKKLSMHDRKRKEDEESERSVTGRVNNLKTEYAEQSTKYNLRPEAEFFVLSHMSEVRRYNPGYTLTEAVRDYVLANGGDPDKPSPVTPVIPVTPVVPNPIIPSAFNTGGAKTPVAPQGRKVFKSIDEAAAAAMEDLNAGKLRHRR